jgi:hypothetical protein
MSKSTTKPATDAASDVVVKIADIVLAHRGANLI